jgi:phage terminase large subunit-like protein
MVEATIRMVDPNVSYNKVHASRGKVIRAEPVAALYEQGRLRDHAYVEGQNLIIEFPTPPEAPSTSSVSAASNRARSRSANQAVS